MNAKVSIIIPTFNRADFISDTLDSIIAQTYSNWECIVVDDGSSDDTIEILKSYLIDKRITYSKRPKNLIKGANSCRNIGFEKSKGKYILWFDSDDILHRKTLEICLDKMSNYNVDFCRFNRVVFYNILDKNRFSDILLNVDCNFLDITNLGQILMNEIAMGTCNVIWRKSSIGSERFNEELVYADEWEYFSRLISNGLSGISINAILLFVRKHPNSTTSEFRSNNSIRVNSKKEAIRLVTQNLVNKQLMTPVLLKYLAGYAISFRDKALLNDIIEVSKTTLKNKLYLKLKFQLFPLWKIYKRELKKIS